MNNMLKRGKKFLSRKTVGNKHEEGDVSEPQSAYAVEEEHVQENHARDVDSEDGLEVVPDKDCGKPNSSLVLQVGMDAEFMAYDEDEPVYPYLDEKHDLKKHGCDEFGHCVEVRPRQAKSGQDLVTNIMGTMAGLPEHLRYRLENVHFMTRKDYVSLLRKQGVKRISESHNVYGSDVLNECPLDIKAIETGKRLVFCGMHVHVSTMFKAGVPAHDPKTGKYTHTEHAEIELPIMTRTLVRIFDRVMFAMLEGDENFNVGRYRSPGFFEVKASHHMEYRSLGATAFTPQRVKLIADIAIEVMKHIDLLSKGGVVTETIFKLMEKLKKTKPYDGDDIRKIWVPWE